MYHPLLQICWPWGIAKEATSLSFCRRAGKNKSGSQSEELATGTMEWWLPISMCFSSWQYCSCFRHSLVMNFGRILVRADSGMMPRVESGLSARDWDMRLCFANSRSISPRQVGGYSSGGFWSQCANTLSQQRLGSWLVCVHHAFSFDCEIPRMFPIVLQSFKMVSTSSSRRTSPPSLHLSRVRSLLVGFSPT